jgi:hypothetical protein
MIRRSECGHCRSIRRSVWIKIETHQDKLFSTGWTDTLVKEQCWSIRRLQRNQQRWFDEKSFSSGWTDVPSVHSVGAVVLENFNGYVTWEGHHMNRCSWKVGVSSSDGQLFSEPLANNSLDALGYLYPLHSPISGCWIVWKYRGVQDTLKIISNPSKCLIAHP